MQLNRFKSNIKKKINQSESRKNKVNLRCIGTKNEIKENSFNLMPKKCLIFLIYVYCLNLHR